MRRTFVGACSRDHALSTINTRYLTPLEPRSRFGDKPLKFQAIYPQNGTAVLKWAHSNQNIRTRERSHNHDIRPCLWSIYGSDYHYMIHCKRVWRRDHVRIKQPRRHDKMPRVLLRSLSACVCRCCCCGCCRFYGLALACLIVCRPGGGETRGALSSSLRTLWKYSRHSRTTYDSRTRYEI